MTDNQISSDRYHRPASGTPVIDGVAAVRAASTGFTVLLLGGVAAPLASNVAPVLAWLWLPLTAVAAFATAGSRIGIATLFWLQGAVAAAGSYLLVLPLVLIAPSGRDPLQITMTFAAAIAVGSTAATLSAAYRARRDKA